MGSVLLVPFGLKNERLYEPRQVPNGAACGCVCPSCKRNLIARQGVATPHFAHAPGEDCNQAFETAVHLAAKQLIADRMGLRRPALKYPDPYQPHVPASVAEQEVTMALDEVRLEHWLGDIRPDIVATANGQDYVVEIAVTHFVDDAKLAKIKQRQVPAFEINVSRLRDRLTFAALDHLLFAAGTYPAKWLYHPRTEDLDKAAMAAHVARLAAAEAKLNAAVLAREEQFSQYRSWPAPNKLARHLRQLGLTEQQMRALTAFVPWDKSFGVPRIVWQSAVLVFISKSEAEQAWGDYLPCQVEANLCVGWLRKVFDVTPTVANGDSIAAWKYLRHLESVGMLRYLYLGQFDIMIRSRGWKYLSERLATQPTT
jgi:hypothetical protein